MYLIDGCKSLMGSDFSPLKGSSNNDCTEDD